MSKKNPSPMTTQRRRALADQVQDLRQARGWTQEELAEFAGVSRQTVNYLESGTVPQEATLRKILTALGVEVDPVEFEEQTGLWLVTIGTLIESIPVERRGTAVDESVRVLASHVRGNVTPLRKNGRPLINEDELDAVAKTGVIEIDEFD